MNQSRKRQKWILPIFVFIALFLGYGLLTNLNKPPTKKSIRMEGTPVKTGQVSTTSSSGFGLHYHYIPTYSHIYRKNGETIPLSITLSLRNVHPKLKIKVDLIEYINTDGQLVKKFLLDPVELRPLETLEFFVRESDTSGGSGSNFLVGSSSSRNLQKYLLIESIMVGDRGNQGFVFSSKGHLVSK